MHNSGLAFNMILQKIRYTPTKHVINGYNIISENSKKTMPMVTVIIRRLTFFLFCIKTISILEHHMDQVSDASNSSSSSSQSGEDTCVPPISKL